MVAASVAAISCSKSNSNSTAPRPEPGTLEMRLALLNSAAELQAREHGLLLDTIGELKTSVAGFQTEPDTARQAWSAVAMATQRLEMMQVGPAALPNEALGGQGLRDEIYSWPLVNPCRIDQELVKNDFTAVNALAVNARGVDALEYVLYAASDDNACAPNLAINTDGSWAALTSEDIAERRAAYATALVADLETRATTLQSTWEDGFRTELTDPQNGEVYGSTREAINALSNAMFYLDTTVKDLKLAVPAGISGCAENTCPASRESKFANITLVVIRANLEAFDAMYHGGDRGDEAAIGFDDLLISIDASELHNDMVTAIDGAYTALDAAGGNMFAALESDPESVVAVHTAIRAITDLMKTQFLSVLDLDLPQRAEGDND